MKGRKKEMKVFKLYCVLMVIVGGIVIIFNGCAEAKDEIETVETDLVTEVDEGLKEEFIKGIDVASHQGIIDAKQATADVNFVIIRLGYSSYVTGEPKIDTMFYENIEKFASTEAKIALYWASHAVTVKEVKAENKFICEKLESLPTETLEKISYLFIDREDIGKKESRTYKMERKPFNKVLIAQVEQLQEELPEMQIGIYTNVEFISCMVDTVALGDVPVWIAWYDDTDVSSFEPVIRRTEEKSVTASKYLAKNIVAWQYADDGNVAGISEKVDLNLVSSKMLG